jgi:hypothetical protein
MDGRLDDEIYRTTLPIDGFIQQEPSEGAPASEKTEAWVFFDDRNIYIAARCWDSQPDRDILTELRRDNNNIIQNENFTVVLDTFHDRRNGFFFQTNALGALRDEFTYLTPMPASYGTGNAIGRMGSAGVLVGLDTPDQSKNIELKPYAASSVATDNTVAPARQHDPDGDVGFDFKYGLTRGIIELVVDYTRDYEPIPRAFTISPGVIVPADGYDYQNVRTSYTLGQQRRISGRVNAARGTFYDGNKTDLSYSGRVAILPQLAIEPSVTVNWVRLPFGDFTSQLVSTRVIVTPTPRMVVSSLVQYNVIPHSLSSSVRLRWEYRPGSELFVVYSDGRNTVPTPLSPGLQSWSFAVKATRLVRF